jgi:3-methyl-2-oxobutanoate hydroxymethyltransferase
MILVGDSLAQVVLGYDSTIPVTLDEMVHHLRAARRGVRRALLIADLPYGTYQTGDEQGVQAAVRCLKEGGAEAVKIEGGQKRANLIRRLLDAEVPVMGHIGLTPQSQHMLGGYKVQGRTLESVHALLADAQAIEDAGAFALVLEGIPRELGALITQRLMIPTIGIGAGPDCDGQVLVFHDLVGLSFMPRPKFVRSYASLADTVREALRRFSDDVRSGRFPSEQEAYHWPPALREQFEKEIVRRR